MLGHHDRGRRRERRRPRRRPRPAPDLDTASTREKLLQRVSGTVWGVEATGYEIRHGRVDRDEPLIAAAATSSAPAWHGLLEGDAFRRKLLTWVAERRGRAWTPGTTSFAAVREAHLDRLADWFGEHIDAPPCSTSSQRGAPEGLPTVPLSAVLRLLTTADTEILAAAHAVRELGPDFPEVRAANPTRSRTSSAFVAGARVVVVRLLGGRRAWPEGVAALRAICERDGIALILLGGESEPDAELAELSLAPAGAIAQAFEYLRHGGVDNTRELLRFLADTFGLEGHGFEPPRELPDVGIYVPGAATSTAAGARRPPARRRSSSTARTRVTGNTAFVDALARRDRARRRPAGLRVGLLAARRRARAEAARRRDRRADHDRAGQRRLARGRRVACRGARGARRPGHPGAVRDDLAAALGGVGRGPEAARRRDAGRDPRVRRAHHRRPGLLQGAVRGLRRACTTRPTSSAASGSRASRCDHARLRTLDRAPSSAR